VSVRRTRATLVLMTSALSAWWVILAATATAQGIEESNFQHIDPKFAFIFDAGTVPVGIHSSPMELDWLTLFSPLGLRSSLGRNGSWIGPNILSGSQGEVLLSLKFREPACIVGFRLKSEYPSQTERTHYSFRFFSGEQPIDQLERWPARGTTRQAYSTTDRTEGISKLVIRNNDGETFALRELRVEPCLLPIS